VAESKTAQMMRLAREFHTASDEVTIDDMPTPKVGRPPGKRSNPNFERLTVLVRKQTRKTAERLWEDLEPDKDMSELVQKLLAEFIEAHYRDNEVAESHYHV
jgi:hypothetical protein